MLTGLCLMKESIDIVRLNIIAITIFMMICGCAHQKAVVFEAETPVASEKPAFFYAGEGRYFIFSAAQMLIKKGDLASAIKLMEKAVELDEASVYLKKELAIIYLQNREKSKALEVLEKITNQHPDHVESLIMIAKIKQGMGDFEGAKKIYEKILNLDPEQKDIYLLLGDLYLQDKDFNNALRIYKQLVVNFSDSYPGHFFIGKVYFHQGDLDKAKKSFEKTLEIAPDLIEPQFEIIRLYQKKGEKKKTVSVYKNILKKNPEDIRATIGLGFYYHENGMTKKAENMFKQLGEKSKTNPAVLKIITHFYMNNRQFDLIKVVTEGMLKGDPNNSNIHYLAGIACDKTNKKKQALKHFEKVLPDSNFFYNSAVHISFIYMEQGKPHQAISYMEEVIKKIPDNPLLFFYLGSFYEEIQAFEKAEAVLNQGIKIDPDNVELHFRMGIIYDKWNKKEKSIEKMKQVLTIEPDNAEALNYLGYTYADLDQNLDEAEMLVKKALKHKPGDGYIIDSLGWVYFKKGLYQKALPLLIKAAGIVPDDPLILEHLGDAYLMTDDKKKALETYRDSLKKKKKDKDELEKKILELTKEKPLN